MCGKLRTDFRGPLFRLVSAPLRSKYICRFVCIHGDVNAFCCLLPTMYQGFSLCRFFFFREWLVVLISWHTKLEKSQWVEFLPRKKKVDFRLLAEALQRVLHVVFGADGKVSIERWYLSPKLSIYVPYEHSMYVSHIHVWVCYICFIFPLGTKSNALEKFTNNIVVLRFFAWIPLMVQRIDRICDAVDRFLRKSFKFFPRNFSISDPMRLRLGAL